MSVSFDTYFGDYLLGLFVTWKSEPASSNGGSTDIEITMQMNMRAKIMMYGYIGTFNISTDDTAW